MNEKRWLMDTSALVRLSRSPDGPTWNERTARGLVGMCTASRLEIGVTARSALEWKRIMASPPVSELVLELVTPAVEIRAVEIQRLLAERGHHRAASAVDILTAAMAEINHRIVLHVDRDFELIAGVTGQAVERLPAGDRVGGW